MTPAMTESALTILTSFFNKLPPPTEDGPAIIISPDGVKIINSNGEFLTDEFSNEKLSIKTAAHVMGNYW